MDAFRSMRQAVQKAATTLGAEASQLAEKSKGAAAEAGRKLQDLKLNESLHAIEEKLSHTLGAGATRLAASDQPGAVRAGAWGGWTLSRGGPPIDVPC